MRKNRFLRYSLIFCVIIYAAFSFTVYADAIGVAVPTPNANQPDMSGTIKELNIVPNFAILEGQTLQMKTEEFDEFIWFDSVEWISSKPDIISCTKNGEIKGLKEGKATITVRAKLGDATDSITVYCARRLSTPKSSPVANPIAWTCHTPSLLNIQTLHYNLIPNTNILTSGKLNVKGVYGSYFYVEFERSEKQYKGFIRQNWMPNNVASNEILRELSQYDLDIFVGVYKEEYKITTKYQGAVEWTISDTSIVTRNKDTGILTAHKPGTATLTAKAGGKTLTCTIHSIYLWPTRWTGAALEDTCVYKAQGYYFKETSRELTKGDLFTVWGDMGGNDKDGWVYGVSENGDWGYVPIKKISTKNTISYYNNLNWGWPLQNKEYNYVNSPHAPRPDPELNDEHRGFDINEKKNQDNIEGQKIVAAFDGVVKYIGADLNKKDGCGYYICITSKTVDPVTGKKIIAIYQHMQGWAKFSEKDEVKKGDWIGNVGNTGRSFGSHLHFEVNNWYAGIGDSGRSDFTYTINPIYFYMDMVKNNELILNLECTAVEYGYSFYFYNYNADKEKTINGGL